MRFRVAFPEAARAVRLGFRQIKGFREDERAAHRERASRRGLRWHRRFDPTHGRLRKDEIERLAEAGALEPLVPGRRNAVWQARAPRVAGLFAKIDLIEPGVVLPPLRAAEQLLLDYERKGLSVSDHPMRHLRDRLSDEGSGHGGGVCAQAEQGRPVSVAGLVLSRQQPAHRERRRVHHPRGRNGLREPDPVAERLRTAALDRAPRAAHAGRRQGRTRSRSDPLRGAHRAPPTLTRRAPRAPRSTGLQAAPAVAGFSLIRGAPPARARGSRRAGTVCAGGARTGVAGGRPLRRRTADRRRRSRRGLGRQAARRRRLRRDQDACCQLRP